MPTTKRWWNQTTTRRWTTRLTILALTMATTRDLARHTVIDHRSVWLGSYPSLWVDYGRIHIMAGGCDLGPGSLRFQALWWQNVPWSWTRPGHLRPIGQPGKTWYYDPMEHIPEADKPLIH
jgi:hypothetical protein